MMEVPVELSNCPFCGSDSVALNIREQHAGYNDYNYTNYSVFVECKKCNCHGPMVVASHLGGLSNLMYKKAHDLWNKRT